MSLTKVKGISKLRGTYVGPARNYYLGLDSSEEDGDEMKNWVMQLNTFIDKPKFYKTEPPSHRSESSNGHSYGGSHPGNPGHPSPSIQPAPNQTSASNGHRGNQLRGSEFVPIHNQPKQRSMNGFEEMKTPSIADQTRRLEDIKRLNDSIHRKMEGDTCYQEGFVQLAIEAYTRAIDTSKSFPSVEVVLNRGVCYLNQGLLDLAGKDIDQAISSDRRNPRALYQRARLYRLQRNHRAADNFYILCFNESASHFVWNEMIKNRMDHLSELFKPPIHKTPASKKVLTEAGTKADQKQKMTPDWSYVEDNIKYSEDIEEAIEFFDDYKRNPMQISERTDTLQVPIPICTTRPLNIFNTRTIWIYNLTCSLEALYKLCHEFGTITQLSLSSVDDPGPGNFRSKITRPNDHLDCRSVTFKCMDDASVAVAAMNGKEVQIAGPNGQVMTSVLTVRYKKNKAKKEHKKAQCKKFGACYHWRVGTCAKGDRCPFTHFEPDRHVDKHPFTSN